MFKSMCSFEQRDWMGLYLWAWWGHSEWLLQRIISREHDWSLGRGQLPVQCL